MSQSVLRLSVLLPLSLEPVLVRLAPEAATQESLQARYRVLNRCVARLIRAEARRLGLYDEPVVKVKRERVRLEDPAPVKRARVRLD